MDFYVILVGFSVKGFEYLLLVFLQGLETVGS